MRNPANPGYPTFNTSGPDMYWTSTSSMYGAGTADDHGKYALIGFMADGTIMSGPGALKMDYFSGDPRITAGDPPITLPVIGAYSGGFNFMCVRSGP
jgi:hypothetical protein